LAPWEDRSAKWGALSFIVGIEQEQGSIHVGGEEREKTNSTFWYISLQKISD
jgi:hypothetical protein